MGTIFVAGTYGVGKSTLCNKLSTADVYKRQMYVDNMTLVNTRKAMLVNSSIEEEIALLPGTCLLYTSVLNITSDRIIPFPKNFLIHTPSNDTTELVLAFHFERCKLSHNFDNNKCRGICLRLLLLS